MCKVWGKHNRWCYNTTRWPWNPAPPLGPISWPPKIGSTKQSTHCLPYQIHMRYGLHSEVDRQLRDRLPDLGELTLMLCPITSQQHLSITCLMRLGWASPKRHLLVNYASTREVVASKKTFYNFIMLSMYNFYVRVLSLFNCSFMTTHACYIRALSKELPNDKTLVIHSLLIGSPPFRWLSPDITIHTDDANQNGWQKSVRVWHFWTWYKELLELI